MSDGEYELLADAGFHKPPPLRRWPAHSLDDKNCCAQCGLTWIGDGDPPTGPCQEATVAEAAEMMERQRIRDLKAWKAE